MPIQVRNPPGHQKTLEQNRTTHDILSLKQQAQRIDKEYRRL
jgi:hypothetical protein